MRHSSPSRAATVAVAYRQIEPMSMQRSFEQLLGDLGLGGETSQAMNRALEEDSSPGVGSRCSLDWAMVQRLNRHLGEALERQSRRVAVAQVRDQHAKVNHYQQLLWAQLYMALMVSSAGRPWGEATRSSIVQDQLWLREKDSKLGEESRWLPLPASLIAAIQRLGEWSGQLYRQAGVSVDRSLQDRLALPPLIHFSPRMKKANARSYSNDQFRRTLREILASDDPIVTAFDDHKNALRHLVATTSQDYLPLVDANALLGHQRGFDANTQTDSFEPVGQGRQRIANFQSAMIDWLQFQPHTPMPISDLLRRPLP